VARTLLDPGAAAQIAHPDVETIEFSRALISTFGETKPCPNP
jgi:hypothetical protein